MIQSKQELLDALKPPAVGLCRVVASMDIKMDTYDNGNTNESAANNIFVVDCPPDQVTKVLDMLISKGAIVN
jgi:hypothetical protein